MDVILWALGMLLVVCGVALAIRHHMLSGIAMVLGGMLSGVLAAGIS